MKLKSMVKITALFLIITGCRQNLEQNIQPDTSQDSIINNRVERISKYRTTVDSINKVLGWAETKFGLWKSKNGDLGLKTTEGFDVENSIDKYICRLTDGRSLKEVIDTLTFKVLGSSFYKDKNHVYTHFVMLDGGFFQIVEDADVKTFKVLGSCYAKDKNYIFGERALKMEDVDYKTFKTCNDCGCFAKDKTNYYFWDDKIDINNITDKETLEIIKKLEQL
ncbi:MAG: DKNYY domain-containing protein [Aestuariibaculum sp.]